jgi:hypothetical protein
MSTFPRTRAIAGDIAEHGPGGMARARAALLLTRLNACDEALASRNGEIPALAQGLLRGLVIVARDLVGWAWLAASDDAPDIAAFTALDRTPCPPAPDELDQILSRVPRARFRPAWHHLGRHQHQLVGVG